MTDIHKIRMRQTLETASRSKCVSLKVGSIITVDDRIVSEGFNGTPKGYPNCDDIWDKTWTEEHHIWSKTHEIHAEMNAINWAARKGIAIEGGILYCTHRPCLECTKNIIASGIKEVYWLYEYRHNDNKELDNFLSDNDVKCKQIIL